MSKWNLETPEKKYFSFAVWTYFGIKNPTRPHNIISIWTPNLEKRHYATDGEETSCLLSTEDHTNGLSPYTEYIIIEGAIPWSLLKTAGNR